MKRRRRIAPRCTPIARRVDRVYLARRWRPLALQWRNVSRPAPLLARGGIGVNVRHQSALRLDVHLHLAPDASRRQTVPGNIGQRLALPVHWRRSPASAAAPHVSRTSRPRMWTHVFAQARVDHRSTTSHTARIVLRDGAQMLHRNVRPSWRIASRIDVPEQGYAKSRTLREPVIAHREERRRQKTRPEFKRRVVADAGHGLSWKPLERAGPQRDVRTVASPALVWRSGTHARSANAAEERRFDATPASRSPSTSMSASAPPSHVPVPASLPADRIAEPVLIDRLADQVIGRVERHMRIERERRGV